MKKILFLLSILAFSFSYGQATTLANKLRITGNTTSATATKVNVQEANGDVNTILKSDLTDVLKFDTALLFPVTGVVGKIYYAINTDLYYNWTGATYVAFGGSDITKMDLLPSGAQTIASVGTDGQVSRLATATYPTITELSYVKGVTSGVQGQINSKYNASNPSNYQTQAEVLSRIDDAIQDAPYDETTWNGVTEDAPSINSVRDKFVSVDAAINAISGNVAVIKTKAEIDTLISGNDLIPLTVYLITGVDSTLYGGSDIYVQAITDNTLSFEGIGKFYNPKYNQAVSGFDVWTPNGSYTVGDKVHWGGRTWENVNGDVGTSTDIFTLDSEWSVITFGDTEYNVAYDVIKYDYTNNAIVYRNEQNSNIVSTSFTNLQEVSDNPIKVFMWGNTLNVTDYVGIGMQNIDNSYNENINFRGLYQTYLNFNNLGEQSNLTFNNGSRQSNLIISNGSSQYGLTFDNGSRQNGLTFDNNSYQNDLTFNNGSSQNNLTFNNSSGQSNLTFNNGSSQNNLTFNNSSGQSNLTANTSLYQSAITFNNYHFDRTLFPLIVNELGLVFQGDLPISTTATKMIVKEDNQLKEMDIPSGGGGSTNLTTTQTASDFTIESNTGTDAIVPLGNGTLAGASLNDFTTAEKTKVANTSGTNTGDNATNSQYSGLATSKQDALGFTPYNATNPSGYQTSSQVTTAITNRIKDDVYDFSSWIFDQANTATRDALFNKFELTSTEIAGKQPLSAVLTATTASFTTADEIKLDGIATGATANSSDATLLNRANHTGTQLSSTISDFNSATRAQTEAELVAGTNITITPSGTGATRQLTIASTGGGSAQSAFTVLANNTSSTATPTEQVFRHVGEQTYAGTITWGTTAPTTILANTYRWQQVGKFVTAQFNFSYNTAATNSQVTFTFPTDMPTPQTVSGFTGALDVICYGVGNMFSSTTGLPTTARVSFLRRNTANTGYEFLITQGSSSSIRTVQLSITYEAL